MSDAKYTESDIQRLGGVIAEDLADQFKKGFEAVETIASNMKKLPVIEDRIDSLESDVVIIKAAVKEISRDIKKLDLAIGKAEHKMDMSLILNEGAYAELRQENKVIRAQLKGHGQKLAELEAIA